jgi:2-aminoadipate transaminase
MRSMHGLASRPERRQNDSSPGGGVTIPPGWHPERIREHVQTTIEAINFTRGVPANESFPIAELAGAAQAALREHGAAMMQYGPSAGFLPLREWLAGWHDVGLDAVLTGNGSLQLIEFLCLAAIAPGDVVFTESPTYDRTITLLRRHGARIVGIRLEADGPDIEALEQAFAKQTPKLLYLIPDFQNPAGATCSREKRARLAELARAHGALIVEDAPYRLLRYRGVEEPTLRDLAPECTLHLSSFTKLIGPGVRTGFLVGPPAVVAKLAKVAEDTYISPGYFAQGITYEWCRQGLLPPQIQRLKALYAPRLEACLTSLDRHMPDAEATRPEGGFFVSLTLPAGVDTTTVRKEASARGLNLADGLAFFPDGGGERFLRLPFCALTPEQIDEGVTRLAASVKAVS